MAEITMSDGTVLLVDTEDYERFGHLKWFPSSHRMLNGRKNKAYLHRLIMGEPVGLYVDHINRDTLDCRRSNLRAVTPSVSETRPCAACRATAA